MPIHLVAYQLPLPGISVPGLRAQSDVSAQQQDERDSRDGKQWLLAVRGYLRWRAGDDWRKIRTAKDRWNPDRWQYLEAANLITDILYTKAC